MIYNWKRVEEIAWIGAVAGGMFALELLVRFDADTITDWRAYAISGGGGLLRAAAGAVLANVTKPKV